MVGSVEHQGRDIASLAVVPVSVPVIVTGHTNLIGFCWETRDYAADPEGQRHRAIEHASPEERKGCPASRSAFAKSSLKSLRRRNARQEKSKVLSDK